MSKRFSRTSAARISHRASNTRLSVRVSSLSQRYSRRSTSCQRDYQQQQQQQQHELLCKSLLPEPLDEDTLAEMFRQVDLNRDGLIDFADLKRLLKQLNVYASRKQVCAMIRAQDPEDTGCVDFARFCDMMNSTLRLPQRIEIRELFNALDRNSKGQITRKEVRDTLKFVETRVTNQDLDEMWEVLDTNQDGVITIDEFEAVKHYLKWK